MKLQSGAVVKSCRECKNITICPIYKNPNYYGDPDAIHPDCPLQDCEILDYNEFSTDRLLQIIEEKTDQYHVDKIIIVKKG